MNIYMAAGVVTGVVVGLIISAILLTMAKKNKKEKFTYDERQKIARGEAYKYAFYVLVIYNAVCGLLDMALEVRWAEEITVMLIGICLAVIVHVIYSIWHDCWFSMNEEPKRVLVIFGVVAVINVIVAVIQGLNGELIVNGMLSGYCANLVVAVMFFVILIALAIKACMKKKEFDAEDEL